MATSLSAKVSVKIDAELANSLDIGNVVYPLSYGITKVLTDGTGADQAKEVFSDTRTLAASGTEDLDLSGVLTDAFGNTLLFTRIKALIIEAAATNTNDVVVGGAASNGFISPFGASTDKVKVKPGGCFVLIAPDATAYAVTAATADLLKIANSCAGTGVTYNIILVGTV